MERLLKEIRKINKHDPFEGDVDVEFLDDDDLRCVKLTLRFTDGVHEGASYEFLVTFTDDYFDSSPKIECLSDIHHPNIKSADDGGDVCCNLFSNYDWDSDMTLQGIIAILYALVNSPNWDDPLHSRCDEDDYEDDVRQRLGRSRDSDDSY